MAKRSLDAVTALKVQHFKEGRSRNVGRIDGGRESDAQRHDRYEAKQAKLTPDCDASDTPLLMVLGAGVADV